MNRSTTSGHSSERHGTRSRILKKAAGSVVEQLEQRQLLSTAVLSPAILTPAGPATGGNTSISGHLGTFSIVPTYTAAVMADPRFNQAGPNIQTAVNYAISQLEAFISAPVTVKITVDETNTPGALGGSNVNINTYSYASIATALQANFANTSVPAVDPAPGTHNWWADTAEARVLGLPGAPTPASDGTYTFGAGQTYTFDPANRAVAGAFDFIGVTEHEITEIMGRIPGNGGLVSGTPAYLPFDLYRFNTVGGARNLTNGGGIGFSVNNGTTSLHGFNNGSANPGDSDDWDSSDNDTFNAFSNSGVANPLSPEDETVMKAIGYAAVAANADMSVAVAGPATVIAGNTYSDVITLTNNGPSAATGVVVTDTLSFVPPAGVFKAGSYTITPAAGNPDTFTSVVGPSSFTETAGGPIASGNIDVFTVTGTIAASAPAGATATNTATVSSTTPDSVPANNTSAVTTTVVTSADLGVVESGPATGTEGTNDTYTFTITNNGPSDAQAVDLLDATPANARFISEAQNSGPAFTETDPGAGNTGNVDFKIGTLAAGATATFTVTVLPEEGANTNTVTASSTTADPTPANNSKSVTTAVADATLASAGAALPIFTEGQSTGSIPVGSFTDNYASALGELDGAADFTATITWAPGNVTTGTITQDAANKNLYHITGTTTFAEEGLYSTSIAIADTDGTSTTTITEQALVVDAPLTVTAVPFTGVEGKTPATPVLVATFTDADPGGNVNDYSSTINWGDGTTTSGTIVANGSGGFNVLGTHEYLEEGTYTGHVNVQDAGAGAGANITGTVSDPAVVATGGKTFTGVEGASTGTLAVATFTDPGGAEPNPADPGPIASHYSASINWGDGTPVDNTGVITFDAASQTFTVSASHSYLEEGAYTPSIVIHHETAPDSAPVTDTVNVSDPAVVATGGFTFTPVEGQTTGPVTVATFTDPGGAEVAGDYAATVTWGDGTMDTGAVITGSGGVFTVTDSHTYAEESGSEHPNSQPYVISVTVAHEAAPVSNTVTDTATVSDPAVVAASAADVNGTEGASLTAPVATFTDPGGPEAVGDYTASIDWGDGSGADASGVISYDAASQTFTVTGTHTYAEEGAYVIGVTVSHENAPDSNVATTNAIIADPAVVPTGGAPIIGVEGQTTGPVVVATFTDPGGAESTSDYTATIDWGDGISGDTSGMITYDAPSQTFSVTAQHTYEEESGPEHLGSQPYVVSVVISHDAAPDSSAVTTTATIAELPVIATALPNASTATEGVASPMTSLAKFIDPGDAEDPVADYSVSINYHDGSAASAGTLTYDGTSGYFTVSDNHTYAEEGKFAPPTITITHETTTTVVNDLNKVTVVDAPITAKGVNFNGFEGRVITATVATFSDANISAPLSDFSATIAWGDGKSTVGTVMSDGGGNFHVVGSHAYTEEGKYPIGVSIKDVGGSKAATTGLATLLDSPLVGATGANFSVKKNVAFTSHLLGSFTDQDALNTITADYQNSTINWGDNTAVSKASFVRTGSNAAVGSFWNVFGSHKYTTTGTKHVTILLKDGPSGSTLTLNLTITVTP